MNALDTCNACDINDADPNSAAGYCAPCEREARAQSHREFIAKMQPRVDAIYTARHSVVTVLGLPDRPNGPNGARYARCGTCNRPVVPNGRGGWSHKR